jgi:hypothetical protein
VATDRTIDITEVPFDEKSLDFAVGIISTTLPIDAMDEYFTA